MLKKIARGAILLLLGGMIVAWAMSVGKPDPDVPADQQQIWRIFT
jgi:hypothetical protein